MFSKTKEKNSQIKKIKFPNLPDPIIHCVQGEAEYTVMEPFADDELGHLPHGILVSGLGLSTSSEALEDTNDALVHWKHCWMDELIQERKNYI